MSALAACGESGDGNAANGFPAEIRIMVNNDETGLTGFAGIAINKGIKLAVKQANEAKLFGESTLVMDYQDPASEAQNAVRITRTAVSDKKYAAMIGPIRSIEQLPSAPLVQSGKLPTLIPEANAAGLNAGEYTFLAGAPISSYFAVMKDYLSSIGKKRIAIITDDLPSDVPIGDIAEKWGGTDGFVVTNRVTVSRDTQDYTAQVAQIVRSNPEVLVNVVTSAAGAALISQARQGGFSGQIVGIEATTSAMLKTAGNAAVGFTFPTRFSPLNQEPPSTVKFVQDFKAEYGEAPDSYCAEGYDTAQWLIKALQESGNASRESIQRGLTAVAAKGFDGAQGTLTFNGREIQIKATILQWNGTENVLVNLKQ
ncbi:hypothetical protein GCM10010399_18360 [Dactylosporangium fulvum]|uniref:ABC transporter substrate-binding protein n=1 Tax=Dactylosporangium fulvum TaxID=53359 RepID=A0ABY5VU42_9ACTN|nr:ABC transporter substrate-binding protein [Dactylosporangium fulvum]UWP80339.1 ABC transporter substrate-binding protein [Dactylosporangium fulvum]